MQDIFERERLEVEPVARVIVRRDRLWIRVYHDGLESVLLEREGGMNAAIVEFNALPDAVRPAAQNHHLAMLLPWPDLVLAAIVSGIVIGGDRFELGRAGVHVLEDRDDPRARLALRSASRRRAAARARSSAIPAPLGARRMRSRGHVVGPQQSSWVSTATTLRAACRNHGSMRVDAHASSEGCSRGATRRGSRRSAARRDRSAALATSPGRSARPRLPGSRRARAPRSLS